MARIKKMTTVANKGTRLEQLQNLRNILAKQIEYCADDPDNGPKLMAQLTKQYRELAREIEEIEGAGNNDDELGELLAARSANGKSDAVR